MLSAENEMTFRGVEGAREQDVFEKPVDEDDKE